MPDWLVVALLLVAAFSLGGCWMVFLKGERPSGYCHLCVLGSGAIYLAWTKNWFGLDLLVWRLVDGITASLDYLQPDSTLGTFVMAVVIFLPVFSFVHFLAWLVRRWDRRRFSRKPQYLHGSRFLPFYFPNKGSSDGTWNEPDPVDLDAGDCDAGGFGGDVGGDAGGVH